MQVEDEEWVKHTLFNYERDRCISKVLSIQDEAAVGKGDNYGSVIKRLKLKVALNSGEVEQRQLILKTMPATEGMKKSMMESGTFAFEGRVLKEVLPVLEKIRIVNESGGEPLSAECYGIMNQYAAYLLEDLSVIGFKTADRWKGIDYDHAEVALKQLSKFHALSAVAIQRAEIVISDFDHHCFVMEPEKCMPLFEVNFKELANVIEQTWDSDWHSYADRLRDLSKKFERPILDAFTRDKKVFNTLNHGDYWICNMMFRYGEDGQPKGHRILDYQLCHYNTPMCDVQYFLNTSLDEHTMGRKQELVKYYCDSLIRYLSLYCYSDELPTLESLSENYKRCEMYGAACGFVARPLMMAPPANAPNMEDFVDDWAQNKGIKLSSVYCKATDTCRNILKATLKQALDAGLFE